MGNELIVRPQVPARYKSRTVSGVVFGSTPGTIAKRAVLMVINALVLYFGGL